MKIFTKVMLGIGLLSAGVAFHSNAVSADTNDTKSNEIQILSNLQSTDKVLQMPEGGYLHGQATVETADGTITHYDSETDKNAVTVDQARAANEELQEKNDEWAFGDPLSSRRASPATSTMSLAYKAGYSSSSFSGSGMRFAGYFFKTTGTTGTGLRYWSYVSGGAVGISASAWASYYSGNSYDSNSSPISADQNRKVNGTTTYYTLNPKSGTYYYVRNIE